MTDTSNQSERGSTLFALLVAIDNYPIRHHRLNGCVADRDAFKAFLERRFDKQNVTLDIQTLTDQEATKANIIQAFSHFRQAKDGDTCVFYYSGHGSRANSPREFWHLDPDRMNESVVAYDSRIQGGKDLMDKELSYLFWEAGWDLQQNRYKDVHFTAVFDCCHAGTITRNAAFLSRQNQEVTERMAEPSPVPNRLEDYYGYEKYKKTESEEGLHLSPPKGRFIQMAASKENETAKELKISGTTRGVFTYNLIEVLEQSNSQMTYADLIRTMQVRVGSAVSQQTPQLSADNHELRNHLFLAGAVKASAPYYTINYDGSQWIMDAGRIQGIPEEGGYLELDNGTPVNIKQVEPNRSVLQDIPGLDKNRPHKAFAIGLNFNRLKVAFDEDTISDEAKNTVTEVYNESPPQQLDLIEDGASADYLIKVLDGSLILTLPGSDHPLFKRVSPINIATANFFFDQADTIAKWRNVLNLKNPRSSIQEKELEINLYRITEPGQLEDDAPAERLDYRDANLFPYMKKGDEWHQPAFRLSIKNTGRRRLYFSALFMQANFKISNQYLPFQELNPGDEAAWLIEFFENNEYKTIPLELYDAFQSWGLTEIKEYIKLFISTDPYLNTDHYEQKALEMDVRKDSTPLRAGRKKGKTPSVPDWVTREIELTIIRPLESQKIAPGRTLSLLDDSLSITTPDGVAADVSFSGQKEAERSLSGQMNEAYPASVAPSNLWGVDNMSTAFAFSEAYQNHDPLSVLELENIKGADKVNADHPIKLQLKQKPAANTFIVPMGYDPNSRLYFPLGHSNESGEIFIEGLPQETATRSLGRSVKLFFHKVVLAPFGIAYNWPQLAMANFSAEDETKFDYEKDIDTIKSAVAGATNIGIMVHGIIGNTKVMPPALKKLEDEQGQKILPHFDLVLTFDYENLNTPIEETARAFKQKMEEVGLGEGHYKNVTIIAHSMGGLVSRWLIEKEGGQHLINHLIMCGTPNNGSPWARVQELAGILLSRAINGAAFLKPYILPLMLLQKLGKGMFVTLQQMHSDKSDFLKKLNDGTDPHIPYTIIMGNTSIIEDVDEAVKQKFLARLASGFVDLTYDALTRFLFETPNDIAVSKPSATKLKGSENWTCEVTVEEVECDHLSYFDDPLGLKGLAKSLK